MLWIQQDMNFGGPGTSFFREHDSVALINNEQIDQHYQSNATYGLANHEPVHGEFNGHLVWAASISAFVSAKKLVGISKILMVGGLPNCV